MTATVASLAPASTPTRRLRIVGPRPEPDLVDAYAELLTPPAFDLTTFPNDEGTTSS
jgi:hypothetical protein